MITNKRFLQQCLHTLLQVPLLRPFVRESCVYFWNTDWKKIPLLRFGNNGLHNTLFCFVLPCTVVHGVFWVAPQGCTAIACLGLEGRPLSCHCQCSTCATGLFCIITFLCTVYYNYPNIFLLKKYLSFRKNLINFLVPSCHVSSFLWFCKKIWKENNG